MCPNILNKLSFEKNLNRSNATCDVLQQLSDFRLIFLHYASVQNKLEFKLTSVSVLEEKIQRAEQQSGALTDQARQKVSHTFVVIRMYE